MKAFVSQTIFVNVATLPRGSRADDITTKLPDSAARRVCARRGARAWTTIRTAGRSRRASTRCALMKQAGAVHISGDQHLGSTIQYGIDELRDGALRHLRALGGQLLAAALVPRR